MIGANCHAITRSHKFGNWLHSILSIACCALILVYLAYVLFGEGWLWLTFIGLLMAYLVQPVISPQVMLSMCRGELLDSKHHPELFRVLNQVTRRARLPVTPELYLVPSNDLNAFALGPPKNCAIALSSEILDKLDINELAGVLGHEVSHILNRDLVVLSITEVTVRLAKLFSLLGILLLMISLPMVFMGWWSVPLFPLLALILTPVMTDVIQLALARAREYNADLGSALLLGSARPLICALKKMDLYQKMSPRHLAPALGRHKLPPILLSHPPIGERIRRLRRLVYFEYSPLAVSNSKGTVDPIDK